MSLHRRMLASVYRLFPAVRTFEKAGCPYFLHPLDIAGPVEGFLLKLISKTQQRVHEVLSEIRFRLWLLKLRLFR